MDNVTKNDQEEKYKTKAFGYFCNEEIISYTRDIKNIYKKKKSTIVRTSSLVIIQMLNQKKKKKCKKMFSQCFSVILNFVHLPYMYLAFFMHILLMYVIYNVQDKSYSKLLDLTKLSFIQEHRYLLHYVSQTFNLKTNILKKSQFFSANIFIQIPLCHPKYVIFLLFFLFLENVFM